MGGGRSYVAAEQLVERLRARELTTSADDGLAPQPTVAAASSPVASSSAPIGRV